MNELEQNRVADLLKQTLAPVNPDPGRDLWPKMLRRLHERAPSQHWFAVLFSPTALSAVPWFDWALLVALVAGICAFPKAIPIWLYHF
ncbi:MAG TPA: hypothetical protein VED66_00230 [Candidatus Sulfotelmatobacter sp.]|nr:hypothetical protein [Candidatus Sulfotelmatobacter sp.]